MRLFMLVRIGLDPHRSNSGWMYLTISSCCEHFQYMYIPYCQLGMQHDFAVIFGGVAHVKHDCDWPLFKS